MATKKKAVRRKKARRMPGPKPFASDLQLELHRQLWRNNLHEERRSAAAERSANALEVIAQYVADYATRDRVLRMLAAPKEDG